MTDAFAMEFSMKINGTSPLQAVYGASRTARTAKTARTGSGPAAQINVSRDGAWISELRASARESIGTVRTDVVDQIRAQLADGSFESQVDLDQVVDGLLGDL